MPRTFDSLTGERFSEDKENRKRWADKQIGVVEHVTKKNNAAKLDGGAIQTFEEYLSGKERDAEGDTPEWKVIDLTSFIAQDIQEAINDIKDAADQVSAAVKLLTQVAKLISTLTGGSAGILEELINAIRDEVKNILNDAAVLGGVYALAIPPDLINGGGVDYYKKKFLDSLEDKRDVRRPVFSDATSARAVFMLLGAPSASIFTPWQKFSEFMFRDDKKQPNDTEGLTVIPAPADFEVVPKYSPVLKFFESELTRDIYNIAERDGSVPITQVLSERLSLTSRAARINGHVSWRIPDSMPFNLTLHPDIDEVSFTFFTSERYFDKRRVNADGSLQFMEFIKEEVGLTHYILVRSTTSEEIEAIDINHEAVMTALTEQRDITGPEKGLGKHTKIFRGSFFPGLDYYQDDEILAPDDDSLLSTFDRPTVNGLPIPDGASNKDVRTKYYLYKMLFVGVRRKFRIKYIAQPGSGGKIFNVYFSKAEVAQAAADGTLESYAQGAEIGEPSAENPYLEEPQQTDVTIEDIEDVGAEEVFGILSQITGGFTVGSSRRNFSANAEAIYDLNTLKFDSIDTQTHFFVSDWTKIVTISNRTVQAQSAAPSPNWVSVQLIDILPPLKSLIQQASDFIDAIADSLIESLNGLAALAEDFEAYVLSQEAKITKIMELIKRLLIPPMAGVHVLTVATNRGLSGIKEQFNKSFANAPQSPTGTKDYPDEYIKYGQRVRIGNKYIDAKSGNEVNDQGFLEIGATKTILFGGGDDRNRRINEPSDVDMRRLGIPVYDNSHFVGGFVFIFEKVSVFNSFIRLLNLEGFVQSEVNAAKAELIGLKQFNELKHPQLTQIGRFLNENNREKLIEERLADIENAGDRERDDEAQVEEAGLAIGVQVPGANRNNNPTVRDNKRLKDVDGSGVKRVLTGQEGPFIFREFPTTISLNVAGCPVVAIIDSNTILEDNEGPYISLSSEEIAQKINEAYKKCAKEALLRADPGVTDDECNAVLANLNGLAQSIGARLSLRTPPKNLAGDLPPIDSPTFPSQALGVGATSGIGGATDSGEGTAAKQAQEAAKIAAAADNSGLSQALGSERAAELGKIKIGSGDQSLKINESSAAIDPELDGADVRGIDFTEEASHLEEVVPVSGGDLIVELEGFGTPEPDMFRRAPALFEFNKFIDDPLIQDFGPERNKLIIEVDDIGEQVIDVTGNDGANPIDAPPEFLVQKANGDPLTFPIILDAGSNAFNIEINGNFVVGLGITGCNLDNFINLTAPEANDFDALGVRPGDSIYLIFLGDINGNPASGLNYQTTITEVDANVLTLENSLAYNVSDGSITIEKIVRANLPEALNNTLSPHFSSRIELNLNEDTTTEVGDLNTLISLLQDGLERSGLDTNTLTMEALDESPGTDGTIGRIRVTLGPSVDAGDVWGYGLQSSIKIDPPGDVGSSASIDTVDITSFFPLTITAARSKFRIELFGTSEPGIPTGFQDIELALGVYTYTQFLDLVNAALATAGLDEVKVENNSGILRFFIDSSSGGSPLAEHFSYSDRVGITIKQLVPMARNTTPDNFIDGVALPPSIETPVITVPISIAESYNDVFFVEITPVVGALPSGLTEVLIPSGVYATLDELGVAIAEGLTLAGFPAAHDSGPAEAFNSAVIRLESSGGKLVFSLAPSPDYLSASSSFSIANGRGSPVTLLGSSFLTAEMRDYGFEKIFDWLNANPATTPTPGFPIPHPLAFLAGDYGATSGPTVYDGTWDIAAGVNDTFLFEIVTPVIGALTGEQEIVLTPGNYASFAALITEIQTQIDAVYGAGVIDVTASGSDQISFELIDTDLYGEFTTIRTRQHNSEDFVSYGPQTSGSLFAESTGTGDVRFMEAISMSDAVATGEDDLFTHLGLLAGAVEVDNNGLSFLREVGVPDYNLLRILEMDPVLVFGTDKVVYEISDIVSAMNAAFGAINSDYDGIVEDFLGTGRLRISGRVKNSQGRLNIRVVNNEDTIAGTQESSEVAQLLFGFRTQRDTDVNLTGIGRDPSSILPLIELEGDALETTTVIETPSYILAAEWDDSEGYEMVIEQTTDTITELELVGAP